jgi:hypothetical protein
MRIWKFTLLGADIQEVIMPKGAKILTVQTQHGNICLWALCNPLASKETRKVAIYGTGNPISGNCGTYISTFQMFGGDLIFHAFDLGEE